MKHITPDYGRVFNRLCHLVALTKEGKTAAAADHIVETVLALDPTPRVSVAEVSEAVTAYFGLTLPEDIIQSSVDRLRSRGRLTPGPGPYTATPSAIAAVRSRTTDATELEDNVKREWIEQVSEFVIPQASSHAETLWTCLQLYMGKAFRRHGAETLRLLSPGRTNEPELLSLTSFLREAFDEAHPALEIGDVEKAITIFFVRPSAERAKYVSQLLDGTFTFFALSGDGAIAAFLRGNLSRLSIFLDTNFIFGLLGLHAAPFEDVSKELLEIISTHKLPFRLYYHEETLLEIQRTIGSIGERLRGQRWKQAVSRAAVASGQLSGIELRYHQLNAQAPLDVDIFLARFQDVPNLLADWNVEAFYDRTGKSVEETRRRGELVAEYQAYLERRRPGRPKPYAVINHDIYVWMAASRQRRSGQSVLQVGALFLTIDFQFHCFEWDRLRGAEPIGLTVLPNQFLQILRPFIPSFGDFDQRFVETFAIPEFRAIGSTYATTASRVLSLLNTFADLPERTAARVLANRMLIDTLAGVPEGSPEFLGAVENAIVHENVRLAEEQEAARAEALLASERARLALHQKASTEAQLRETQEAAAKAKAEESKRNRSLTAERDRARQDADNMAKAKARADRSSRILRWTLAALVFGVMASAVLFLPSLLQWYWWERHHHQLGLKLAALLVAAGLSLAIAVPRCWRCSLGTLVLGSVLVVIQIID